MRTHIDAKPLKKPQGAFGDPARHRWGDGLAAALRELAGTRSAPDRSTTTGEGAR